jgi:hypothetical protein
MKTVFDLVGIGKSDPRSQANTPIGSPVRQETCLPLETLSVTPFRSTDKKRETFLSFFNPKHTHTNVHCPRKIWKRVSRICVLSNY